MTVTEAVKDTIKDGLGAGDEPGEPYYVVLCNGYAMGAIANDCHSPRNPRTDV